MGILTHTMTFNTSPSTRTGLNEFDLLNLDHDTGKPPESRVSSVTAALSIFSTLRLADEPSAINRARTDAMFDGAEPYDRAALSSTGQGGRTNLNWGESQRYLDIAMSAFVDLNYSLERLVNVYVKGGEPTLRQDAQDVISEEITRTVRAHPAYHSAYMRLCTEFTKHGVGVAYFDNPDDWRFRVSGLSDFIIPRQTEASEDSVEVACSRRQYLLHELYALIRNPEKAKALGWDPDEVTRVIIANAKNGDTAAGYNNWEDVQRELKNNDLNTGVRNTSVSVIHMWVREFSGKVSFLMFAEETPKAFMLNRPEMFAKPEEAFVFFTYGVGSNGTFHSVRGLGHRIFNHIQTSNRMRCHRVDAAMLGGSVMLQPETQRALDDLSFTMYGPYSILSPNVRVIEKAIPNLTQSMDPALADLENQLAANVDLSSTYGPQRSSPYRNNLQTEHDLAVASSLTGSTINLFYAGWNRLMREVTRRIVNGKKEDPSVREFFERCADRGITADVVKSIDHGRTSAVRAIGAGSAANRLLALRELNTIAGSYDEVGRRNLIRDITSERVGRDIVDRYAPPTPEPRTTAEAKIAFLENQLMASGQGVPVFDTEIHGMHLRTHAPALQQALAAIQSGEADPVATLPLVQALYQHCAEHTNFLAGDVAAAADVAGMKQLLQQAEEIIINFSRKIEADARKAAEQGMGQSTEGEPAEPTAAELKLRDFEIRQDIAQRKAQLDMDIKQRKADQDLALKDAKSAMAAASMK